MKVSKLFSLPKNTDQNTDQVKTSLPNIASADLKKGFNLPSGETVYTAIIAAAMIYVGVTQYKITLSIALIAATLVGSLLCNICFSGASLLSAAFKALVFGNSNIREQIVSKMMAKGFANTKISPATHQLIEKAVEGTIQGNDSTPQALVPAQANSLVSQNSHSTALSNVIDMMRDNKWKALIATGLYAFGLGHEFMTKERNMASQMSQLGSAFQLMNCAVKLSPTQQMVSGALFTAAALLSHPACQSDNQTIESIRQTSIEVVDITSKVANSALIGLFVAGCTNSKKGGAVIGGLMGGAMLAFSAYTYMNTRREKQAKAAQEKNEEKAIVQKQLQKEKTITHHVVSTLSTFGKTKSNSVNTAFILTDTLLSSINVEAFIKMCTKLNGTPIQRKSTHFAAPTIPQRNTPSFNMPKFNHNFSKKNMAPQFVPAFKPLEDYKKTFNPRNFDKKSFSQPFFMVKKY